MTVSDVSTVVRPYGDTTGDGQVQVSFTLPVPGVSAADRALAEVNLRIPAALGREMVVVGATIGTDAHTVGIDAILDVKGHAGEKGLEYYREIQVLNMGAQVPIPAVVARAAAERADAVLVSQVVTQRDAHLSNVRELAEAIHQAPEFRGPPASRRPLLVIGGPRFDPSSAAELGVDKFSAAERRPVRWPATWSTRSRPRSRRDRRADTHPPSLCLLRRRGLRRWAGGRGVRARAVRRRGDRGVRADGRRRGAVRLASDVQLRALVRAGDVLEVSCEVTATGRRSRQLSVEARVVCRADPSRGPSAARVLDTPVVAVIAAGTVAVPPPLTGPPPP